MVTPTSSPEEKINDGIALLSRFGFDAGLLDDLRRSNGKTMNIADTEAFFQILSILNTEESRREIQTAANQTSVPSPSVSDFLQSTRNLQGQLISLSADVRQITKVEINNENETPSRIRPLLATGCFRLSGGGGHSTESERSR